MSGQCSSMKRRFQQHHGNHGHDRCHFHWKVTHCPLPAVLLLVSLCTLVPWPIVAVVPAVQAFSTKSSLPSFPSSRTPMSLIPIPRRASLSLYARNEVNTGRNDNYNNDDGDFCNQWNPTTISNPNENRRRFLHNSVAACTSTILATTCIPVTCRAGATPSSTSSNSSSSSSSSTANETNFRSAAYGREEYTNSITASRDTNISPREAYDSIQYNAYLQYPLRRDSSDDGTRVRRALDVGAGAGVSTQVLWDMGYREIDACDWSGKAWERFVLGNGDENGNENDNDNVALTGNCPPSVHFYELDDERYLNEIWRDSSYYIGGGNNSNDEDKKFDAIVFNFAVNESKAKLYAKELLRSDVGRLLAPTNVQSDYWLKQNYQVYDAKGNVLWSAGDVGAWSVQFQPDVTQDTCQGIWCAPFNGFQKRKQ